MTNYINFFYKNKLNIIIIIIWFCVTFFCASHHELWWDETRALTITQNFSFDIINNDGHPYLWYFILYPFSKLAFPFYFLQVISFLFVFTSILLLFFKSNFNYLLKLFISFSAGMIYFLPVLPRNYSLIPFLIFLLACFYNNRFNYPFLYCLLLILLSQTHSYTWGFCFICAVFFLYEKFKNYKTQGKKEKIKTFSIFIIFTIYLLFMFFTYLNVLKTSFWAELSRNQLFQFFDFHFVYEKLLKVINATNINGIFSIFFISSFLTYLFSLYKIDKKSFFILLFSMLYFLFFSIYIYFEGILYQKLYIIFLFVIFSYWISRTKISIYSKIASISINILFFVIMLNPFLISYIKDETDNNFTNTKEICIYLKKREINPDEVFIVTTPGEDFDIYKDIYKFDYKNSYNISLYEIDNREKFKKLNLILTENKKIKYLIINENLVQYINLDYQEDKNISYNRCKMLINLSSAEKISGIDKILKINRK